MGSHVDDAELSKHKPIISVSLGVSAIFLLGGLSKQQAPVAVLVRSGDCLIMSGECRLVYHAVPAILTNTFDPLLVEAAHAIIKDTEATAEQKGLEEIGESKRDRETLCDEHVLEYLQSHRINLNVRQVVDGINFFPPPHPPCEDNDQHGDEHEETEANEENHDDEGTKCGS